MNRLSSRTIIISSIALLLIVLQVLALLPNLTTPLVRMELSARDLLMRVRPAQPEQVVALLNPYLEAMTQIIYRNGGTVDKYEGDAVMAFFGEPVAHPDHALRAARTALEMHLALAGLRKKWRAAGVLPEGINFQIGIGLNSGPAFVGLLGSEQRINYTAIGDNVNLSARLRDLTKAYKWPILLSDATYQQIKNEFEAEFIEPVTVKGKTEAIRMYKLTGRKGAPTTERVQPLEI